MKKISKILSVILAILMVISIVPITASAAKLNYAGDSVYWLVENGTLMIYGSGEMYSYTSSTAPWRSYKDKIKEISMDEEITSIGDYAFYGLNITKVEIPGGIRKIGTCAFANCTSLSEVVIRKGVEIIDSDAFANCTSLNNVYYYSPQNDWGLIDIRTGNNYLLNAELIVNGDGQITWEFDTETGTLTFNGTGEIPDYYNEDEDYRIPQPWKDIKNDIKHIVINDGITVIGNHAFVDCYSLETVTMSSVTTIANGAFSYAESLKSITVSNSLKVIEDAAFHECVKLIYIYYLGTQEEWNNVSIGENLNDEFFSAKVYTSDYYVSSDSGTYSGFSSEQTVSWELDGNTCTLTIFGEGYIPDEIAPAIGSNMYKYAGYIRTWEPYKYDIKRIVITEGITLIGRNVFRFFPNLTEVVIPTSVTEISNSAFCTCDSITDVYYSGTEEQWNNITIGTGNESLIGANINYNSTGPHTHDYEAVVTDPTCTEQGYTTYTCECGDCYIADYVDALNHIDNDNNGYCDECSEYFCTATGTCGDNLKWEFDNSTGTLTISGTGAMEDFIYIAEESSSSAPWFDYKKLIKEIVITDGITSIGNFAFYYCKNLEKVSIPESVTSIGSTAFGMCDNLKTVNIPDSVTTIKNGAFMCSGLTEVSLPKNLTTITGASFRNCPNLTKVTIPETVTTIGEIAFAYCTSLTSITIPESVTSLGKSAFEGCSNLKKVVILANLTRIENCTFYGCSKLDELTIPKSVTYSGPSAFAQCSNVSNIYYTGTEEEWNNIEFNDLWLLTEPFGGPTIHYNYCLHEYNMVITPPTCTEQGYTTYTCECGDSYVDDYVDATGHNYIDNVCTGCGDTIFINGWQLENGKWAYYVNSEKLTNKWIKDSIDWCYLGEDGYCVSNTWKADSQGWCYVGADCRIVRNKWLNDNGKWYFIDANGYMVSNKWMKDSKDWVYLGSNGAMLTNAWAKDSQGWCYVGSNGYCVKNQWIEYNNNWYYIDANGYMVTGTVKIGPVTYKFNSNGVWIA